MVVKYKEEISPQSNPYLSKKAAKLLEMHIQPVKSKLFALPVNKSVDSTLFSSKDL